MKHDALWGSLSCALFMLSLWGCNGPGSSSAAYEQAQKAYNAGQYAPAQRTLTTYLAGGNASKNQKCKAFYLRGLCYRQQGQAFFSQAQKDFETVLHNNCDKAIAGMAHAAIGHILFESRLQGLAKAQYHYHQALKVLKDESVDQVLFRLGVCLQRQGQWQKADHYFQQCMNDFPGSPLAPNARQRLGCRIFRLQAGAYSNLAAANLQIRELSQSGWAFDAKLTSKDSRMLYLVQSGAFNDYQNAYNELNRLKRSTPSAIIVVSKK